jgi:tRNA pseudouridine55 synthase
VARVRRVLRTRAVGHAGTLDPFATGLLVVLVGPATRLARFVERQAKGYLAVAALGATTDTDDLTGTVTGGAEPATWPEEAGVRAALAALSGTYAQRPPAYSARRVRGRRGYELARAGKPVDLPATPVTVHSLDLVSVVGPLVTFRAVVSAGTYVRALARDLGERLGTGAHLRSLRREWIGPLRVEDAVPLDALDPGTPLLPPLALIGGLPRVEVGAEEAGGIRHGRPVVRPGALGEAALVHEGDLVAVAEGAGESWQPRVVLGPA